MKGSATEMSANQESAGNDFSSPQIHRNDSSECDVLAMITSSSTATSNSAAVNAQQFITERASASTSTGSSTNETSTKMSKRKSRNALRTMMHTVSRKNKKHNKHSDLQNPKSATEDHSSDENVKFCKVPATNQEMTVNDELNQVVFLQF